MNINSLCHQCDSHEPLLSFSCDSMHDVSCPKRTKVTLIYKACVDKWFWTPNDIKIYFKNYLCVIETCKTHWTHHDLWWLHYMSVYPSPFHQVKVTLHAISPRMKSTSHVEVHCPLAAGVEQSETFLNRVHWNEVRHLLTRPHLLIWVQVIEIMIRWF